MNENDKLRSTILAALAKLDEKGNNDDVSNAMAIVFEAFRMYAIKQEINPDSLYTLALES